MCAAPGPEADPAARAQCPVASNVTEHANLNRAPRLR